MLKNEPLLIILVGSFQLLSRITRGQCILLNSNTIM